MTRGKEPRLDRAFWDPEQPGHLGGIVPVDTRQHQDDPQLVGQGIDRLPDFRQAAGLWVPEDLGVCVALHLFAGEASHVSLSSIEGSAKGHADEPGAEPAAIAQLAKAPEGLGEDLLRDVFGVLPMAEHAIRHPERQRLTVPQAGFELLFEVVHGQRTRPWRRVVINHVTEQDAAGDA